MRRYDHVLPSDGTNSGGCCSRHPKYAYQDSRTGILPARRVGARAAPLSRPSKLVASIGAEAGELEAREVGGLSARTLRPKHRTDTDLPHYIENSCGICCNSSGCPPTRGSTLSRDRKARARRRRRGTRGVARQPAASRRGSHERRDGSQTPRQARTHPRRRRGSPRRGGATGHETARRDHGPRGGAAGPRATRRRTNSEASNPRRRLHERRVERFSLSIRRVHLLGHRRDPRRAKPRRRRAVLCGGRRVVFIELLQRVFIVPAAERNSCPLVLGLLSPSSGRRQHANAARFELGRRRYANRSRGELSAAVPPAKTSEAL